MIQIYFKNGFKFIEIRKWLVISIGKFNKKKYYGMLNGTIVYKNQNQFLLFDNLEIATLELIQYIKEVMENANNILF